MWTDRYGHFVISEPLYGHVIVTIQHGHYIRRIHWRTFPESNRLKGIVVRVKEQDPSDLGILTSGEHPAAQTLREMGHRFPN